MKTLNQRKAYIAHKSSQLGKITDAFKYTHRLNRIMQYEKMLMEINTNEIKRILK